MRRSLIFIGRLRTVSQSAALRDPRPVCTSGWLAKSIIIRAPPSAAHVLGNCFHPLVSPCESESQDSPKGLRPTTGPRSSTRSTSGRSIIFRLRQNSSAFFVSADCPVSCHLHVALQTIALSPIPGATTVWDCESPGIITRVPPKFAPGAMRRRCDVGSCCSWAAGVVLGLLSLLISAQTRVAIRSSSPLSQTRTPADQKTRYGLLARNDCGGWDPFRDPLCDPRTTPTRLALLKSADHNNQMTRSFSFF